MRLILYLLVLLSPVFALVAQQPEQDVDVDSHVIIDTERDSIPANVEFSATSRTQESIDLFYFRGNGEGAPLTQACWTEGSNWKTCRVFQYVFNYVRGRGHITAISRTKDRHDLFFVEKGYEVVTLERWRKNGGSRKLEVFWVRRDGALMHAYTENDGDAWVRDLVLDRYSEAMPETVTAMSKDSNSMVVAWITTRGALEVARYEGNGWIKTQVLIPGSLPTNTKLVTLSISRNMMNIFFVGRTA
ncbi:hypothetical protein B0T10DRAFT_595004 [Thelonectria olida]|uniref:Uncharacterized protein n=1 Tax=Thelonectria olida TaxID=1576542 RepID=A0A9P8VQZ9_9HYPO|nr:hypothetical protein B0T10DRAFT_595004 [Thelonectria olida]